MLSSEENKEEYYEKVKELIVENSNKFSPTDRIEIYEFLMNFCVVFANRGKQYYAYEYLKFVEIREFQNLILIDKKIPETKFNNIIFVMFLTDNLTKAEQFIYKYAPALEKSIRENTVNFNLAEVAFLQGDFDKAQELIINFKHYDVIKKLKYDKLLLKIYFEKGEFLLLENKLKAYKKFIQINKKVTEYYRIIFTNFGNCLLKLAQKKPLHIEELRGQLSLLDLKWFSKKMGAE